VVSLSWDPFQANNFISASGSVMKLWDRTMDRSVIILKQ